MSGWNAYVDTQLIATGSVVQAAIFGLADAQIYANAGDFQFRAYNAMCAQEDGTEKEMSINEAADILGYVTNGTTPPTGFRMNGSKYQVLRTLEGPTLYLKNASGGACFSLTNSLGIIGVYDTEATKEHNGTLSACNKAVEDLATYLRGAGF